MQRDSRAGNTCICNASRVGSMQVYCQIRMHHEPAWLTFVKLSSLIGRHRGILSLVIFCARMLHSAKRSFMQQQQRSYANWNCLKSVVWYCRRAISPQHTHEAAEPSVQGCDRAYYVRRQLHPEYRRHLAYAGGLRHNLLPSTAQHDAFCCSRH